jgi:GntR family transcriptional regulator
MSCALGSADVVLNSLVSNVIAQSPGSSVLLYGATLYSTMLNVKLHPDELLALHDQVAAELRRAIANGEAARGERLPPARDLAAVLNVNSNTVLRALRILRDEGLLEFRRGRGITVSGSPDNGAVVTRARELIDFARGHGYRREELARLIESLP